MPADEGNVRGTMVGTLNRSAVAHRQRLKSVRWPNGLRLSGARRTPPSDEVSPSKVCSGTAARVRCSRGLGALEVQTGYIVYRIDREHG